MADRVTLTRDGGVAILTLDDGKVNAFGPAMQAEVNAALDTVEREGLILLLTGRPGVFCGGFDLKYMRAGGLPALRMIRGGFEIALRCLELPRPVVLASTGHAMALGAFLTLVADYRVGAAGDFKYQANEVAIGMTVPRAGVEICRQRLATTHLRRVLALSEPFAPQAAITAGFLDAVVPADRLQATALAHAHALEAIDFEAHARTKARVQADAVKAIRRGLAADMRELTLMGLKQLLTPRSRG